MELSLGSRQSRASSRKDLPLDHVVGGAVGEILGGEVFSAEDVGGGLGGIGEGEAFDVIGRCGELAGDGQHPGLAVILQVGGGIGLDEAQGDTGIGGDDGGGVLGFDDKAAAIEGEGGDFGGVGVGEVVVFPAESEAGGEVLLDDDNGVGARLEFGAGGEELVLGEERVALRMDDDIVALLPESGFWGVVGAENGEGVVAGQDLFIARRHDAEVGVMAEEDFAVAFGDVNRGDGALEAGVTKEVVDFAEIRLGEGGDGES